MYYLLKSLKDPNKFKVVTLANEHHSGTSSGPILSDLHDVIASRDMYIHSYTCLGDYLDIFELVCQFNETTHPEYFI